MGLKTEYAAFVEKEFTARHNGDQLRFAAIEIANQADRLLEKTEEGSPDRDYLVERLGMIAFYMQAICGTAGIDPREVLLKNMGNWGLNL